MIELQPGDGVVLYTDGITEAENMKREQYGLERLCQLLGNSWAQDAERIKQTVIDDLHEFIGDQKIMDDITLLVLKQIVSLHSQVESTWRYCVSIKILLTTITTTDQDRNVCLISG